MGQDTMFADYTGGTPRTQLLSWVVELGPVV